MMKSTFMTFWKGMAWFLLHIWSNDQYSERFGLLWLAYFSPDYRMWSNSKRRHRVIWKSFGRVCSAFRRRKEKASRTEVLEDTRKIQVSTRRKSINFSNQASLWNLTDEAATSLPISKSATIFLPAAHEIAGNCSCQQHRVTATANSSGTRKETVDNTGKGILDHIHVWCEKRVKSIMILITTFA